MYYLSFSSWLLEWEVAISCWHSSSNCPLSDPPAMTANVQVRTSEPSAFPPSSYYPTNYEIPRDSASVGAKSLPHAYSSAVRVAPLWRHCCNTIRLNTRKGFNCRQLCSGPTDNTLLHDSKSRQKTWKLRALLQTCGDQQTDEHWKLHSSKHTSASVFNMSIGSILDCHLFRFGRIFIFLEYFCLILRIPATVIKFLS